MLNKNLIFTTIEKTCNQRSGGLHKGCNEAKVKVGKRWKLGLKTIEKQRTKRG